MHVLLDSPYYKKEDMYMPLGTIVRLCGNSIQIEVEERVQEMAPER